MTSGAERRPQRHGLTDRRPPNLAGHAVERQRLDAQTRGEMTEAGIVADEDLALADPPRSLRERLANDADPLAPLKISLGAFGFRSSRAARGRSVRSARAWPADAPARRTVRTASALPRSPSTPSSRDECRARPESVARATTAGSNIRDRRPRQADRSRARAAGFRRADDRRAKERTCCASFARLRWPHHRTRASKAFERRPRERSARTANASPETAECMRRNGGGAAR